MLRYDIVDLHLATVREARRLPTQLVLTHPTSGATNLHELHNLQFASNPKSTKIMEFSLTKIRLVIRSRFMTEAARGWKK